MKKWPLFFLCLFCPFLLMATPLPAEQAFQASIKQIDPNAFMIHWKIAPGYFLYRDRIHLKTPQGEETSMNLAPVHFPEALSKTDKQGRQVFIYRHALSLPISVLGKRPGEAFLKLSYQGCADDGFCYPPMERQIKLSLDGSHDLLSAEFFEPLKEGSAQAVSPASEAAQVESVFAKHHWLMVLLIFYGFGLLLAFTPCVLPMVPVLSSIIVGHGHNISTRKAFFLSLAYVLSMAITYAGIGAIVATLGSNLQIAMQSPWVIGFFALIFVVLAFSMLGYYELKLPLSWQTKLASINRNQASGHYISAAIMGALSILILSPCVTAPLIGALSYIARSGNIARGALSLFFLGLGMGTPLLLIGTSARHWLPKAGHWMNAVKYFFAVMLFAVAIHLLARVLPGPLTMVLWATLLIFSGIYAGALIPAQSHQEKFKQASGIILLIYGLLILIGASMGNSNPLQPLGNIWGGDAKALEHQAASLVRLNNLPEVKAAIAKAEGQALVLDFYADWCDTCHAIEAKVLQDPKVLAALKEALIVKVDLTQNNAASKALREHFKVIAPPAFLFFDKEGQELPELRLYGQITVDDFLKNLDKASL